MKALPKYIVKEVTEGRLTFATASFEKLGGASENTFRLLEILEDETHPSRGMDATMALAEKMVAWFTRNNCPAAIGKIREGVCNINTGSIYRPYWRKKRIGYVTLSISEPYLEQIKEQIEQDKSAFWPVEELTLLKENNYSYDRESADFYGYTRFDYDGYKWFNSWFNTKMNLDPTLVQETDAFLEQIRNMFPDGVPGIRRFLYTHDFVPITAGGYEYNAFYEENAHFRAWIRFRTEFEKGDYSMYIYFFQKPAEDKVEEDSTVSYDDFLGHIDQYVGKVVEFAVRSKKDGSISSSQRVVWDNKEFGKLKEDSRIEILSVKLIR